LAGQIRTKLAQTVVPIILIGLSIVIALDTGIVAIVKRLFFREKSTA
jgi:hypothetical protein